MSEPRNNRVLRVLEDNNALAVAWAHTSPEQLATLLRNMPVKSRNRMLSTLRTPSSKITPATARLFTTNVNRAGSSERRRAASYICQPIVDDLSAAVHDAAMTEADVDDAYAALEDALDRIAEAAGDTMATLATIVGALGEPDRLAPAITAAVRRGLMHPDVAATVAELMDEGRELLAEHVARHHADDNGAEEGAGSSALETLWEEAKTATSRMRDVVAAGELPDPDDIAVVNRYGNTLDGESGELDVEPTVAAVLAAYEAADNADEIRERLERFAGLTGPDTFLDAIRAVNDAAAHAVTAPDDTIVDRLLRFGELVDSDDPMRRFELANSLRDESAPPEPNLIDAAMVGLLSIVEGTDGTQPARPLQDGGDGTASSAPQGKTDAALFDDSADTAAAGPSADDVAAHAADTEAADDQPRGEDHVDPTDTAASDRAETADAAGLDAVDEAPTDDDTPPAHLEAPAETAEAAPSAPAPAVTGTDDADASSTTGTPATAPEPDEETLANDAEPAEQADADADGSDEVGPDAEEVGATLAGLVADMRFGFAHHVAVAAGQDYRAAILAEAAWAHAVRSPASSSAAELVARVEETPAAAADSGSLALRAASLIRVALLDPTSGAPALLRQLVPHLDQLPHLRDLAVAVASVTEQNLSLPATGVAVGVTDALMQAEAISQWANDQLNRQYRQNRLHRGIEVWKAWTAPDGLLGHMLGVVATNDPKQVNLVRDLCKPVAQRRDRAAALEAADKALRDGRPGGAKKIIGPAREQLLRHLGEAVDQALAWCDAHTTAEGDGWATDLRAELAAAEARLRPQVLAELNGLTHDTWAHAAATAAAASINETLGLLHQEPLTRPDIDPVTALNRSLVLAPEIVLNSDFTVVTPPTLAGLVAAARRSRAEAFDARLAKGDFGAADTVLELSAPRDDLDQETSRQKLAEAERKAKGVVSERWDKLNRRFESARSRGRISEDDAARLYGKLLQATPHAEATESSFGRDLGRVHGELERIDSELTDAIGRRREQVTADLRAVLGEGTLPEAWVAKLTDLLERDELGAAEEYLHRAINGDSAPEDLDDGPVLDEVLRTLIDAVPHPFDQTLAAAARAGGQVGDIDFSVVDDIARPAVADALEAWATLAGDDRPTDLDPTLMPILSLLGIIPTKLVRTPELRALGSAGRWFVDVQGDKSGHAYVPDFGSRSQNRRRFLICWDDMPVGQLWDFAAANAPADQPVYVLWMNGTLTGQQRIELARQARRRGDASPVVVIDAAVILRCALEGRQTFDVTMRAVLPYAAPNPYDPDLLVNTPVEMFYGRQAERNKIAAPAGSSFISGGRRLGKSALLRSVQQSLDGTDVHALLIVIQHVAATPPHDPAELWPLLTARLIATKVLPADTEGTAEAFSGGVRAWLADNPERRLLLMLDECDFFLRADANSSFRNVAALRDLMSDAGRFKVVFSGLQHVARYRKLPNQPLSHLPQPLVIGPLDASAASRLVRRPLHALGWAIIDEQVDRIVTFCACNASVLQLACGQLIERLRNQPVDGLAPWDVPEPVLNELLASRELGGGVRDRLFLTLELDHRYKLLAYLMAWRALNDGLGAAAFAGDLRLQAIDYWPEGFASQGTDDVRALCDELVGLGVFAGDAEDGYRMLSPATVRLFGTPDEVEAELLSASELYESNSAAGAAGSRMHLAENRYSPLTAAQLADVVAAGRTQLRIVAGSRALRTESVPEALGVAARRLPGANVLEALSLKQWRENMTAPREGHLVVVSDMTYGRSPESWKESIDLAHRRGAARTAKGTRSAVLLAGPADRWLLSRLVTTPEGAGELVDVAVGLRRIDLASLQAWDRIEELNLAHPQRQRKLLTVTGGWPMLVERVLARMRQTPFDDVIDEIAAALDTPEGAAELIAAVGLDVDDVDQPADPGLVATFTRLAETGWREHDLADLLALDDDLVGEANPAEAVAILNLLGMLDEDDDGLLGAEPVLASCVRTSAAVPS